MGSWTCACHARATGPTWVCACNVHDGSKYPRTRTTWSSAVVSSKIVPEYLNSLRTALNAELSIRSLSATSWTSISVGSKITDPIIDQFKNTITKCWSRDSGGNVSWISLAGTDEGVGDKILYTLLVDLRNLTNRLQDVCICNCNYCPCNCNYCTCDCNYCTCDCNYCTCNCNYCPCNCNHSCTCQCNYSDERLKSNIEYI